MPSTYRSAKQRATPPPNQRKETERVYAEFLRGKHCIVVGPGGYMTGQGRGEWIDSHDVVVRLNWGAPVPEQMKPDLGARTSVLYKRLLKLGKIEFVDVQEYLDADVGWIVSIDHAGQSGPNTRHLLEAVGDALPVVLERQTRQRLRVELQCSPLVGLIAAKSLLAYQVASVTITGCDFYASGYHDGYGGRDYRESMARKEGTIGPTHDAKKHLHYLAQLQASEPRLKFDAELAALVENAKLPDKQPRRQRRKPASTTKGTLAVIPARYHSSRFPGKPLALIDGKPMILHVCERVREAVARVVVATDDERIASVVREAGYEAMMTGDAATGTDRVAEVARKMPADIYINVQGDEPLIDPAAITALLQAKQRHPREVINAMAPLRADEAESSDIVKAVVSGSKLLYCSRGPVPATKDGHAAHWKQQGLYALNRRELQQFSAKGKRMPVERTEDVEIVRFVEMGVPVRMVEIAGSAQAVEKPEHIAAVEALLHPEAIA